MQLAGPTPWIAPLATGHPLGLPGAAKQNAPQQKVQPVGQSKNADAAQTREQAPDGYSPPKRGGSDPDAHLAPPSIVQLKILQMLDEQANQQIDGTGTLPEGEGARISEDLEARQSPPPEVSETKDAEEPKAYLESIGGGARREPAEGAEQPAAPPAQEPEVQPAKTGYEEASSLARNAVLSTLP